MGRKTDQGQESYTIDQWAQIGLKTLNFGWTHFIV